MFVAGPIQSNDEARALEQAAYLTDLRARLAVALPKAAPLAERRAVRDPFAY